MYPCRVVNREFHLISRRDEDCLCGDAVSEAAGVMLRGDSFCRGVVSLLRGANTRGGCTMIYFFVGFACSGVCDAGATGVRAVWITAAVD